ncbi:MAG: lysozyme [Sphingomonas bacterium]|uniref:GH25 family lysozyme n=1 Tax=Sphingomonas bacterium TaxID=1895847 RepID=UPI002615479C|nr:GH25 family lysozyme [Sphingomonas bacterium]MDB5705639.1 lysozyme [Sphingomonas bacterium]
MQGIDVSHYQGRIDWPLLPGQGVDFAYIKATEGGDYRDDRFAANWQGAGQAGIARGAYHFFTLCRSGADQAANFIATVPLDAAMLSPVVDLEAGGNCAGRPSRAAFLAEVTTFIQRVEARFGKPVTLYLTREFDTDYAVSANIPRRLWLRRLILEPGWGARPWSIWQASSFRRLRGVPGRVDWNVARP